MVSPRLDKNFTALGPKSGPAGIANRLPCRDTIMNMLIISLP
jgi:hypothetical protein